MNNYLLIEHEHRFSKLFCSRHWQKMSDDPGCNLSIRKTYDLNKRAPNPLLTGLQRMPFGLCMFCQISTGVRSQMIIIISH